MLLNVKLLGGSSAAVSSVSIEADIDESVESLKQKLEKKLNLDPETEKKLLYMGKTLHEGSSLGDYKLTSGSKLHLMIKSSQTTTETQREINLEDLLSTSLRRHFKSDEETRKVIHSFRQIMQQKLNAMNLNDIERFATHYSEDPKNARF